MVHDERIRPASTVMLMRDGAAAPEVFVLKRVAGMPFAGGMTAFPGGGVDPSDLDPAVPWAGPGADWWAAQWALPVAVARAQVVAAVRELFEETGILLAGSDAAVVTGDGADREVARIAVTEHRTGLAAVLAAAGSLLRSDLLRPWARWITPAGQTRRYDTYFFLAALPDGQSARTVTTEAERGHWALPAQLLDEADAGALGMMPPTRAMLIDLAGARSVSELLDAPRVVRPVTPQIVSGPGEVLRVVVDGQEITMTGAARARTDGRGRPG